jgi:Tol biopolymer transport system component
MAGVLMPLSSGTRLGSYEIVAPIGEGGMGQVYRARDTRLARDVALKLLPPGVSGDPDRLRRFEREAKTLASLNHPHIAQIYGVETLTAEGRQTPAIAMELVEGRTLGAVISAGLDLADALSIARQIADALEAAHEAGIVHRDLKPANVIVRDDGIVKVLDFGLAKAAGQEPADADGGDAMTVTSPAMTQAGVILGTAAYMSPEQARGRAADRRADIWAFGAVLFEMLTRQRLFGGETVTEVLAAVLKDPIRLDRLPAGLPPSLHNLIGRCLERDPRMRLRDVGEARILLARIQTGEYAAFGVDQDSMGRSSARRIGSILGSLAALALAAIAAYVAWTAKPQDSRPVRRFDLPAAMAAEGKFAIAPDGSRIAYVAQGHLFVHTLATAVTADLGAVPVPAEGLIWSPDSRRLAYAAESDLRVVPAEGGPPFTVCRIPGSGRLTRGLWHDDGTIYFGVWRESLYRVAASGGTPALVSAIVQDTEVDFHSVAVLPDGRLLVTTHLRGQDGVRMDLVEGGSRTSLADDLDIELVAIGAPGELLFVRVRRNPGVWAVPFDGGRVDLTRATLLEAGAGTFSVSREETLVSFVPPRDRREFVWVSHDSAQAGPGEMKSMRSVATMRGAAFEVRMLSLALSPDSRRVAFSALGADGGDEFFVRDLETGRDTRVPRPKATTGAPTGGRIAWTPSGRLLLPAGGVEALQIFDWPADGSATGRPLVSGMAAQITPTSGEVVFTRDERSHLRLYRAPIRPDGSAGDPAPVFPGPDEPSARYFELSPDGKLLAFADVEPVTNRLNIFVTTWPDARERQQVTTEGGTWPRFARDSRRLFFMTGGRTTTTGATRGELRVVTVTASPLSVGTAKLLMVEGEAGTPSFDSFAVASDDRILMTRVAPASPGSTARLVLLQNWRAAMGR